MSMGCCHMDPASVNDASPKASLGGLYTFDSNYASNTTPTGIYRYVQIKDLAVIDGDVCCADAESGTSITKATQDRSADLLSNAACGVAVGAITADYYGYLLVRGRHDAVMTDGSVATGDPLVPSATTDGAAHTATVTATGTDIEYVFGVALEGDTSTTYASADINCL